MINQDCELDAFKREIDLRQFAESLGYQIDRRESWRGSAVLRRAADKIVVKRNGNGHYVFFSLRDDDDNGTVIDFVQRRQTSESGGVCVRFSGHGSAGRRPHRSFPSCRQPARTGCVSNASIGAWPKHSGIRIWSVIARVPAAVLSSPRFRGRMRIDDRGNTVFPHFDAAGLCGYEIKNRGFTGFAAGGKKGLWFSHTRPGDRRLVLTESAIDALSYATLFPDSEDRTRYASLGGRPSLRQMGLVQAAVIKLPEGAEIVAAFDADEAGRWLVAAIGDVVEQSQAPRTPFSSSPSGNGRRGLESGPVKKPDWIKFGLPNGWPIG